MKKLWEFCCYILFLMPIMIHGVSCCLNHTEFARKITFYMPIFHKQAHFTSIIIGISEVLSCLFALLFGGRFPMAATTTYLIANFPSYLSSHKTMALATNLSLFFISIIYVPQIYLSSLFVPKKLAKAPSPLQKIIFDQRENLMHVQENNISIKTKNTALYENVELIFR